MPGGGERVFNSDLACRRCVVRHQTCVMDSAKPVPIADDFHDQIEALKSCFTAILCVQEF